MSIKARRVRFDWGQTPMHWVPGDPFTTHVINVLHMLLPAGERWFCDVYRQTLPFLTHDRLRDDVKGFIGQEAVHARAHTAVLDHLASQGLDTSGYTRKLDWLLERILGDHPLGRRWPMPILAFTWLVWRLAIIAAIEHFTCVLGWWAITESGALDDAGADPTMVDLLRWHGAEEVEHRAVAFDVYQELGGGYCRRVLAMLGVFGVLGYLWMAGTSYLMRHDPSVVRNDRPTVLRYLRVSRRTHRLPSVSYLVAAVPRYLRTGYHPLQEGSTEVALVYLARSPAAHDWDVA